MAREQAIDETQASGRQPWLPPSSLVVATALSTSAGIVDAVTFLDHNHAFATFVTGNLVLIGLHLAEGQNAAAYALPIAAYVVGAATATLIGQLRAMQIRARSHLLALAIAFSLFISVALVTPSNDHAFVALLTAGTAVLNTSFRLANGRSYNSAYMTGNLQTVATSLAGGLADRDRKKLAAALDLGLVISAFFGGALLGGLLVPRLHQHTLLFPATALALIAVGISMPVGHQAR